MSTGQAVERELGEVLVRALRRLDCLVVLLDARGGVRWLNAAAERACGHRTDEVRGLPAWEVFVADRDVERFRREYDAFRVRTLPDGYETHWRSATGPERLIRWTNRQLALDGDDLILLTGLDVTEQRAHETYMAWLTSHDPVTGLLNDEAFERVLERELERARRYDYGVALVLLGGDGDVRRLAARLDERLRAGDVAGRVQGEVAVMLPFATAPVAELFVDDLLQGLEGGSTLAVAIEAAPAERPGALVGRAVVALRDACPPEEELRPRRA